MHIKFLPHGKGDAFNAVQYLIKSTDHNGVNREEVSVLRGNPFMVGQVADSLTFSRCYTSGVIAWSPEDSPSEAAIQDVLDEFEKLSFAGLDSERVSWTAILHRNGVGGVHIHLLVARVDLQTRKSLNIAPPGWQKSFDTLRDFYNLKMGWARPDDPGRARPFHQDGFRVLLTASALRAGVRVAPDPKTLISEYLMQRITAGRIIDRSGIIEALKEVGFEINRQVKDYVSVKDSETGTKYRLKGGIYEAGFTIDRTPTDPDQGRAETPRKSDKGSIDDAFRKFKGAVEKRAAYNRKRFKGRALPSHEVSEESSKGIRESMEETQEKGWVDIPDLHSEHGIILRRDDLADMVEWVGGMDRDGQDPESNTTGSKTLSDHYDAGLDSLRNQQRGLDTLQTRGEIGDDRTGSSVTQIIQTLCRRLNQSRQSFSRAVGRIQQPIGEFWKYLSELERGVEKMIIDREGELEHFKQDISLVDYAESIGYRIDRKESSRNSVVMRDGDDKIIVTTDSDDGHGIYFSVHDPNDNGSVIDFIQHRQGINIGEVRKLLRQWIKGTEGPRDLRSEAIETKKPAPLLKDMAEVILKAHRLKPYTGSYLQKVRGLSQNTINRFKEHIRQDERGNVCFIHRDRDGITGWEVKNEGFTGFSSGGKKSFFTGIIGSSIKRLVITESAIDAMSYFQNHGKEGDCYLSFAGELSEDQRDLLRVAVNKTAQIVVGTDSDEKGMKFFEEIRSWRPDAMREVSSFGKDWNEEVLYEMRSHGYNMASSHFP